MTVVLEVDNEIVVMKGDDFAVVQQVAACYDEHDNVEIINVQMSSEEQKQALEFIVTYLDGD